MDSHTPHRSPASRTAVSNRRGKIVRLLAAIAAVAISWAGPSSANAGLRYFGFAGGCDTETFVQETAPFSNLCTIDLQDPRLSDREWLTKMMVRNMRLVVITQTTFFDSVEIPGQQHPGFDLKDDYRQSWRNAIAGKEDALDALAVFFYVADEPDWTGISRGELAAVVEEIKGTMPGVMTATSFNRMIEPGWFEGQEVPTDAVGYHQYELLDPRVDPGYQANVELIKSFAPDRDFLYVLDSWWNPGRHGEQGLTPENMAEVAQNVYAMALEDPDAVGLIGFYWSSMGSAVGARDLPDDVRRQYWVMGSEITGKCLGPSGTAPESALFFGECSYYATLQVGSPTGSDLAAAMPRERSYGTWVLDEGDVVGGLKIQSGDGIRVHPSLYVGGPATMRIYDATDGRLVWESGPRVGRDEIVVQLPD